MAKKKKRQVEENETKHGLELAGLLWILISVIGFGGEDLFGPVGKIISNFAIFLNGSLFIVPLIMVFVFGGYELIKNKKIMPFTIRYIGFYLVLIGALVLCHITYVTGNNGNIANTLSATVSELLNIFTNNLDPNGGGIIGALFSLLFVKAFSVKGAYVVAGFIIVVGLILMFNISLVKLFKNIINNIKTFSLKKDFKKEGITVNVDEEGDSEDLTTKKIISSLDELDNNKVEEEVVEEEKPIEESVVINYDDCEAHNYILPDFRTLLKKVPKGQTENKSVIKDNVVKLEKVLSDFDIVGKVVQINVGPSITQYELELRSGTKVNKVLSIQREIALMLAAKDVRIEAPIPGKSTIGIEIPNKSSVGVSLREVMEDIPKSLDNSKLAVALGKNIMGKTMFMEINKTPHLLVAGATGSGKSVCINSIIATILLRAKPDEVKLVLVDPKKVEMSMYNGVPHLLMPVVTDPKKASIALIKMVSEMERRYNLFEETKTKNIGDYNKFVTERKVNMNGTLEKLPYIVIIIDELADLMLVAAKEVEDSILRITQMARAAGIHLIVATQRPSTDVITGVVKANIPSRISFAVSSSIDSRTILDMTGAEKLLGKGDMLFLPMGENTPVRIQGAFVSDEEILKIVDYTVSQQKAQFDNRFSVETSATKMHDDDNEEEEYEDPLYKDIVEFVVKTGKASASLLQRKYKLGYNRAARIIDLLEERGIVGPQNGSKPREVLVKLEGSDNE